MNESLIKLNKKSKTSLSTQLYRSLLNAIRSGQLKAGERLPTEEELTSTLKISRTVVQKAYAQLMDENIIQRIKGRGTFVCEKSIDFDFIQSFLPMTQLIELNGYIPSIKNLNVEVLAFNHEQMGNLELSCDEKVLSVTRIYYANSQALTHFTMYYPLKYYPDLETKIISNQPMMEILKDYPITLKSSYRSIFALILADEVCIELKLQKGSAGFKITNIAYDSLGRAVQSTTYYLDGQGTNLSLDYYKNLSNQL
jgi:GntR family transcriptional regulator